MTSPSTVRRSACPHNCPDGCGLLVTSDGDTIARVQGDGDHPWTGGFLCVKVAQEPARIHHPDRLTTPLLRDGPKGSGQFRPCSWDEAIRLITSRWKAILAESGGAAILPYSFSGTVGLVQNSAMEGRLWLRMGASWLDRTICFGAGSAALSATFGAPNLSPDPEDIPRAAIVLVWGANPVTTHPHYIPFLDQARRNGARVIVIDPVRTRTAKRYEHVAPRPGTDAALALGIVHLLFEAGAQDQAFLEERTTGWAALRDRAAEYPVHRVAQVTGLPEATIRDLAAAWASARPGLIKGGWGLQRHTNGGQTYRALAAIPAVTGDYARRGGGLLVSTSGTIKWNAQAAWATQHARAIPRTINMNQLGEALLQADPPIHSLYVFNSNPATIAPDSNAVRAGLARDDLFTVVHDLFLTDTARWADVVLPATSAAEHADLYQAYGHVYLQAADPVVRPPGEARSNTEVLALLAEAMGYDEAALTRDAPGIRDGMVDAAGSRLPEDSRDRLATGAPVRIPGDAPWTPIAAGRLPTRSGRIELWSQALADTGHDPLPGWTPIAESAEADPDLAARYPLALITPAAHHFLNSSFANVPRLRQLEGRPTLFLHPDDAAARGLATGDLAAARNDRGRCLLHVEVTTDVLPGCAVSPSGWWHRDSPGGSAVNVLTSSRLSDLGGGSTFHTCLVQVERAAEEVAP